MLSVIDFWAEGCNPCKMLEPVLEELRTEYGFTLRKINIEENQQLAQQYNVMSLPTIVFEEDDKEVDRIVGFGSKESIEKIIKQYDKISD